MVKRFKNIGNRINKDIKMRKTTIVDLPKDIKTAIPEYETNEKLMLIIKEAEAGEFHDFKNKKYVCGKFQVHAMLFGLKDQRLNGIIHDIIHGVYDESPDAEDKAEMKKDWLANGGTESTYKAMFGED